LRLHYDKAGSGPALLLLHGIGSNSRSFRHQLAGLADAFTVIAWDAPGYGRSEDPLEAWSLDDAADEAARLLEGFGPAHVLGVSMGGVIAQVLYHRHAEQVRSLILVDTTAGGSSPERLQQRLNAIDTQTPRQLAEARAPQLVSAHASAELIAELADIMAEVRPAGYRHAAIALARADTSSWLKDIAVPTLVIHGDEDGVVPLATAQQLARAIPGAKLVVLHGAGHVSNQEQPGAFNAAVREFLGAMALLG
jgi:pimeloyl-ACP methyl ester carboxylesterase